MEEGNNAENQDGSYNALFTKVIVSVGVIGILSSLISFYAILPLTVGSIATIMQLNPYDYFLISLTSSPTSTYALLVLSAIVVSGSAVTLFIGRNNLSVGTRTTNRIPFFMYLSIFVLVELILSLIAPYISPAYANNPVLGMPLQTQNFVFIVSTFSQAIILQFLPISVLILIILIASRKLSLKSYLNPDRSLRQYELPIIIISSGFATALIYTDPGSSFLNFVSFFVLDLIYIRFGLLRAIVAGFTISQFNIILQINQVSILPYVMYLFLFVWSLLGLYSLVSITGKYSREQAKQRAKKEENSDSTNLNRINFEEPPTQYIGRMAIKPSSLWIRCVCPSCGNYNFFLKNDLTLECKSCHQLIEKNAVGEFNIHLSRTQV